MLKTADTNKANWLSKLNILLSAKEFPSFWMDEKGEEFCINIYCFTNLYVCHTVHYLSFLRTLPCKRLMWMSSSVSILQTLLFNPTATKICKYFRQRVYFPSTAPARARLYLLSGRAVLPSCTSTISTSLNKSRQLCSVPEQDIMQWHSASQPFLNNFVLLNFESWDGFRESSIFMVLVNLITFDLQSVISGDLDPK